MTPVRTRAAAARSTWRCTCSGSRSWTQSRVSTSWQASVAQIIRKGALPLPAEVPEALREAATVAAAIRLREPRPERFPVLFTDELDLLEAPHLFLHEHAVERAHTTDTLRTYAEILYDWF